MNLLRFLDLAIYWSIVIMPFSVAIAPGMANAFIGFFSVFFIIKKVVTRQPFTTPRIALLFFGLFFVASLASIINSISFNTSLQGITKILKNILVFLVCSEEIRDKKHVARIMVSVCCGVSLASIDALWQMVLGFDFIHHNVIQDAIGLARPTASFPNPNVFGVYMAALTPLILGLLFFYYRGRERLMLLVPGILGLTGIYLTLSRGAGMGIYLAVLFMSIVLRKKLLVASLLGILIIYPFLMPKNVKDWAKEINYNPMVFMFNKDRLSIYANTVSMIKQHPFVGVGLNTFSKNYGRYRTDWAEKNTYTPDGMYAHNIYLQMAGEVGLMGLAAFLLFLFQVFRLGFKAFYRSNEGYLRIAVLSLLACLIAFLVNGLTETSLYYSRVAMVFWYLIGAVLASDRLVSGQCAGGRLG